MVASKRFRTSEAKVDRTKPYPLPEAVALLLDLEAAKFDETIDVAMNLGVDPRQADQMVRGALVLPHGLGKSARVLVFAKGEKEHEAREAGADFVGGDDLAQKIQNENWLDFDRVIATPDMMGVVGRLGRILGPRGIMPNPKLGTVTMDVATAVREQKAGKVEYRVDKTGIIHVPVGRRSFTAEQLVANATALIDVVMRAKPASSKGIYIKKITLSSTMGPGIRIDPSSVSPTAA
ncbi:MAG: 50S ribosomal protein L1 [Myxococcales bacterium]|nr:MAG: 50S ribosomal protein L1 [Myxococcales bacterium]